MKVNPIYRMLSILVLCVLLGNQTIYATPLTNESVPEKPRLACAYDISDSVDRVVYVILSQLGYDISIISQGMESAIVSVNTGEADILHAQVAGIEDQYPNLIRIPEPLTTVQFDVYANMEEKAVISSWLDLSGRSVGILYQQEYTQSLLPPTVKSITYKDNNVKLLSGLDNNEYEFAIVANVGNVDIYIPKNAKRCATFSKEPAYIYVNRSLSHLVEPMTSILSQMNQNGITRQIINSTYIPRVSDHARILHISSYNSDTKWIKDFRDGLHLGIDDDSIEFRYVSLYTENNLFSSNISQILYNRIRGELFSTMPNIVIVSDEQALGFVREHYYTLFNKIPIIVCGIDTYNPDYWYGFQKYFTGVIEQYPIQETVATMLDLFPQTKNLFVINDYTPSGISMRNTMKTQLEQFSDEINIIYNEDVPIYDLLRTVEKLPADTLVLSGRYAYDSNKSYFVESEFQHRLGLASKMPILGVLSATFGYGQIGGKYVDSKLEGQKVAQKINDVLLNQSNADRSMIIDTISFNVWKFDYSVMTEYGIKSTQIPQNSILINQPKSIYDSYPNEYRLFIILVVLSLLVAGIMSRLINILYHSNKQLVAMQKDLFTLEELIDKDQKIQAIQSRLQLTVESAPLGFVSSKNGICQEANYYARNTLDATPEKSFLDHYHDLSERNQILDRLFQDQKQAHTGDTVSFVMPDKTIRRFFTIFVPTFHPMEIETFVWFLDIEEREHHKDEIIKAQTELARLIHILPCPVMITDIRGSACLYANEEMLVFCNTTNLSELVDSEIYCNLVNHPEFEKISDFDEDKTVFRYKLALYDTTEVISTSQKISYQGTVSVITVIHDVASERERTARLYEAMENEKAANQLKSKFLISMSHEIRTPMNAIIGLTEIELYKNNATETTEIFKKIRLASKNLLTIINDILDFSKIESETLDIDLLEIEIEEVISSALLMASQRVGSKKIEILLKMSSQVPSRIYSDPVRLWQILKNLLDNSAKYTQKGIIQLTVAVETVADDATIVSFTIADTGHGMSQDELEQLFTPYKQFHNRQSFQTGTGVGMTITKELVQLMGGEIAVSSEVGVGTTTTVKIPFGVPEDAKKLKDTFINVKLSRNKILIADNEPTSLEIMNELLGTIGIQPVCVASGLDAIQTVEDYAKNNQFFDIIILDYMMDGINGIETAKKLRTLLDKTPTKLLMVSAYTKQLLTHEIKSAGFDDVIEKPFSPTEFVRKLCDTVDSPLDPHQGRIVFTDTRVLVVEDNLTNQEVAVGILEFFGIQPVIANNGAECLVLLEKESYDLILMDILMPVLDGHKTTIIIRQNQSPYQNIPIIAMTANVMQDEVNKCLQEGMNAHIGKPVNIERLQTLLTQWLPEEKQQIQPHQTAARQANANSVEQLRMIDGLDPLSGLTRFANKDEKYKTALLRFAQENHFVHYADALQDTEKIKQFVHSLKGTAGNLGAMKVYNLARMYEQTQTKEAYTQLADAFETLSQELIRNLS